MTANKKSWKFYIKYISETLLAFSIGLFCIGMYFSHSGSHYPTLSVLIILLFVFVTLYSVTRLLSILPMPGIMIFTPIAPLIVLILVLGLLPLLQWLG